MHIEWLAQLPGYNQHKEKIEAILARYKEKGIHNDDDLHLALARLEKSLKNKTAVYAYKVLAYLYFTAIAKMSPLAIKLLDICPIHYEPLLKIPGDETGCGVVNLNGSYHAPTRLSLTLKQEGRTRIYLDSTGVFYTYASDQDLPLGSESQYLPNRDNVKNVSFTKELQQCGFYIIAHDFIISVTELFMLDISFFENEAVFHLINNRILNGSQQMYWRTVEALSLLNECGAANLYNYLSVTPCEFLANHLEKVKQLARLPFVLHPLAHFLPPTYLEKNIATIIESLDTKTTWKLLLDNEHIPFKQAFFSYYESDLQSAVVRTNLFKIVDERQLFVIFFSPQFAGFHEKIWPDVNQFNRFIIEMNAVLDHLTGRCVTPPIFMRDKELYELACIRDIDALSEKLDKLNLLAKKTLSYELSF